jgi:F0F1-type ATP synthase epsilon subunit
MNLEEKIEFLTKFYGAISRGILDHQIELFCENEVKLKEAQKQKQRDKKKAERAKKRAEKLAKEEEEKRLQEEAKKHLPNVA